MSQQRATVKSSSWCFLGYLIKPSMNSELHFFFQAGVSGVEVEQNPSALSLQEGTSSVLTCNFSTTMRSVQWFRQNSRGSLVNLFYLTSGTKQNGRLNSTFNNKEGKSTLHIRDAQLEDSGTYLCAAMAQCFQQACSLAPNCVWVCSLQPCHRQTLQVDFHSCGFIRSPPVTKKE